MITVDRHQADVTGALATAPGRWRAIASVTRLAGGGLDGLVHAPALEDRRAGRGARVVSASYFGRVEILEGLWPALVASGSGGGRPGDQHSGQPGSAATIRRPWRTSSASAPRPTASPPGSRASSGSRRRPSGRRPSARDPGVENLEDFHRRTPFLEHAGHPGDGPGAVTWPCECPPRPDALADRRDLDTHDRRRRVPTRPDRSRPEEVPRRTHRARRAASMSQTLSPTTTEAWMSACN